MTHTEKEWVDILNAEPAGTYFISHVEVLRKEPDGFWYGVPDGRVRNTIQVGWVLFRVPQNLDGRSGRGAFLS